MLTIFDFIRDLSPLAVTLRLCLAVFCGGLVGIERASKRRPAGFRTHILICLGAAITTLTSQYLLLEAHLYTDVARLGAQVIAGVSFIGAGSIIVTGHRRVKGFTTAAGLWVSAIVGLCCGAGYVEGALLATALILTSELLFSKLEHRVMGSVPQVRLLVQYDDTDCLNQIIRRIHDMEVKILDLDIQKGVSGEALHDYAGLTLSLPRNIQIDDVTQDLRAMEGVFSVEEI